MQIGRGRPSSSSRSKQYDETVGAGAAMLALSGQSPAIALSARIRRHTPRRDVRPILLEKGENMKQTKLGSQGLVVSAEGLGCMGMSAFYGPSDEAENLSTLARAIELGINFFDTAEIYGPFKNEILLAKALKGKRDKVLIATKVGSEVTDAGER